MIYKNIFEVVGTDYQNKLITGALDKIHFDWSRLKPRYQYFQVGWAYLNSAAFWMEEPLKAHAGPHPEPGDTDVLVGDLEGRKYILGVFYPYSGRIIIDLDLMHHPIAAANTVSAEVAHLVDYFLPLTDKQRVEIMALMLEDDPNKLNARDWWEGINEDYGTVYYSLPGEGFMQAFTLAYSDMDFDGRRFTHTITKEQAPRLRAIIGIERTDITPAPTPAPATVKTFKVIGDSKIFHTLTHYPKKSGKQIIDTTGFVACKTCKPK